MPQVARHHRRGFPQGGNGVARSLRPVGQHLCDCLRLETWRRPVRMPPPERSKLIPRVNRSALIDRAASRQVFIDRILHRPRGLAHRKPQRRAGFASSNHRSAHAAGPPPRTFAKRCRKPATRPRPTGRRSTAPATGPSPACDKSAGQVRPTTAAISLTPQTKSAARPPGGVSWQFVIQLLFHLPSLVHFMIINYALRTYKAKTSKRYRVDWLKNRIKR